MTKPRKRNRTTYKVIDWAPRLVTATAPGGARSVDCRCAVVNGDVLRWVNKPSKFGTRLAVTEQLRVTNGYWLPARFVVEGGGVQFVVDVDLVPHTTSTTQQREHEAIKAHKNTPRRATWTRLWVDHNNGCDVVRATHHTDRYDLRVTSVQVLPLTQQPGKRGQRAITGTVQVVVNDLLNVVLPQAALNGNLLPGEAHKGTAAVIKARMLAPGEVPKQPSGRARAQRVAHTDELLLRVRDVHQATPRGSQLQAVMQQLDLRERQAQNIIKKSQLRYNWGLAGRRKSNKKHTTHKRGNKT